MGIAGPLRVVGNVGETGRRPVRDVRHTDPGSDGAAGFFPETRSLKKPILARAAGEQGVQSAMWAAGSHVRISLTGMSRNPQSSAPKSTGQVQAVHIFRSSNRRDRQGSEAAEALESRLGQCETGPATTISCTIIPGRIWRRSIM